MKKISKILFVISMMTIGTLSEVFSNINNSVTTNHYVPHEVLISYSNQFAFSNHVQHGFNQVLGKNQFTMEKFRYISSALIHSDTLTVEELIATLSTQDGIVSVSPNYLGHFTGATNDAYYDSLWAIENRGQNGGTPDADIDAKEAWDIAKGSKDIVAVVMDTGVDYTHSDLQANMWDGSAFGFPHHGYDFLESDNDPMPSDDHGTHVAGIIGATGNNHEGVVGVAYGVSLMNLRIGSFYEEVKISNILHAIQFMIDKINKGVNIVSVNMSFGFNTIAGDELDVFKKAIKMLQGKGVIVCAAAGNSSTNNDMKPLYPASYTFDNVITVAASNRNDTLSGFSSYGLRSVDLAAPGESILSTVRDGEYTLFDGTSMATPQVTGAIALVASYFGKESVAQRRVRILSHVDPIASLSGKVATGGRLNLYKALGGGETNTTHQTTWTTGAYDNNEDRNQTLRIKDAKNLTVKIVGETEKRYDFIYIYNANGQQIQKLDGKINKTINVMGSSITARLTSDFSYTKSGVTVRIKKSAHSTNDKSTWTTGRYKNNEDRKETLSIKGAQKLKVKIVGETEKWYDFIYIYDANRQQIKKLDGKINETIIVTGNRITARLTSDLSYTKSGVTVRIEKVK